MSDVKRYKKNGEILGRALFAAKDGEYVRYHDHTALRARLDAVTEERNVQNDLRQIAEDAADELRARAERAEAALATARRDALEEAAREIDCGGCYGKPCLRPGECMQDLANEIRALANEAETSARGMP